MTTSTTRSLGSAKRLAAIVVIALSCCGATVFGQVNSLRPAELPAEATANARPVRQASADVPLKSSSSAQLMLSEAFTLSKSGKSIEEFSKIIDFCDRARQKTLTPEEVQYARDLMAWAYNKRGEAHAAQAVEFVSAGQDSDAAKLDRQALQDFHAAVKVNGKHWKALHNRGVSYGILGMRDEALADFAKVVELKPDFVDAWFNLAEMERETGLYAEAFRDYSRVLQLKPEDAAAYRGRGQALIGQRRAEEAVDDFNKSLELEPKDAACLAARAVARSQLSQWDEAGADFRAAIAIDPDCAAAYRGAAWIMATCPQVKYRNTKAALEAAEQALALAEAQGTVSYAHYDTLAAAYANAGRFAEAQRAQQKALSMGPEAESRPLTHRLAMYNSRRPFRDGTPAATVQPASAKVRTR
jgi:tetratricopeptide (TPR) repeat protein